MSEVSGYAFDMEADNFYLQSNKVWIIHFKSLDKKREMSLFPFRQSKEECKRLFLEWHNSFGDCPTIVSYNGIGYDHWMLWKHLDIPFHIGKSGHDWLCKEHKCKIVDLYVLSQFLSPDRPRHSLASWGEELHNSKIDFHDFSKYSEEMRIYCEQDVDLTIDVYYHLREMASKMYAQMHKAGATFPSASKALHKDYYLYSAQAYTGIKFDKEAALKLIAEIDVEMAEIEKDVLPQLPPRKLKEGEKKYYSMPAKPFKKDRSFSSTMEKWIEKHNAKVLEDGKVDVYGKEYEIIGGQLLDVKLPMEIKDGDDIKEWFMERNWSPSMWNFKRDERGKPMRDSKGEVITTSPKIQEGGKICPNLLKLDGELPKKIVRFLSLRNRKSVVTGWLNNWRLEFDGRLSAEISGYTPTFRVKHSCITNLPKASPEVVKGYEMRSLFVVDKGMKYVSADAAALENRTVADYTYKHDNGKFADLVLNGDSHCYSEDTEIITPVGWKTFGELKAGEFVGQWNNGKIEFVEPTNIVWQDYEGEMISFKNQSVDLLVTPNHRMMFFDARRPEKIRVKYAKDFVGKFNNSLRFHNSGTVVSEGLGLSCAEIGFIVAAQADSSFDGKSYRFEFSKERKIAAFRELCKQLGICVNETNGKGGATSRFFVHKDKVKFVENYLSYEKKFTSNLCSMSVDEARVFIEEVSRWDGTVNTRDAIVFDTTCKESRDVVSTVATLAGFKVTDNTYKDRVTSFGTNTLYRSYISKKTQGVNVPVAKKEHYSGKVGCVSVPSTFIVVRRAGKVLVSGNSFNATIFFPKETEQFDITSADFNKDDPSFKPWRNKAKIGAYSLAYGASVKKFTKSLDLTEIAGKIAYENYWNANEGLKMFKEEMEKQWEGVGQKKYIVGKDGRVLSVRSKHLLVNLCGQSLGATVITYALCFMDNKLGWMEIDEMGRPFYKYKGKIVKRLAAFHDQGDFETEPEVAEEVGQLIVQYIKKAGEVLKMQVELDGEYKVGSNAAEIH